MHRGGILRSYREQYLVDAVHKNTLFALNSKTTRKNKFEIKAFIFGN